MLLALCNPFMDSRILSSSRECGKAMGSPQRQGVAGCLLLLGSAAKHRKSKVDKKMRGNSFLLAAQKWVIIWAVPPEVLVSPNYSLSVSKEHILLCTCSVFKTNP